MWGHVIVWVWLITCKQRQLPGDGRVPEGESERGKQHYARGGSRGGLGAGISSQGHYPPLAAGMIYLPPAHLWKQDSHSE